jgi:hypothetical protein
MPDPQAATWGSLLRMALGPVWLLVEVCQWVSLTSHNDLHLLGSCKGLEPSPFSSAPAGRPQSTWPRLPDVGYGTASNGGLANPRSCQLASHTMDHFEAIKTKALLGMVVHTCNPSNWEVEVGGLRV